MVLGSLLLSLAPSVASAQAPRDDYVRFGGFFALGLGGDAVYETPLGTVSPGLDPTLGGGLRIEGSVWDYLEIGAQFELLTFEADVLDSERETVLDADLLFRLKYLIEVEPASLYIEPYLALPVGFSAGILDDLDGTDDEIWPGWNIGAMAGAYLITSAQVGFFLEGGWRFHQLFSSATFAGIDNEFQIETHQFAINVGIVGLVPSQ